MKKINIEELKHIELEMLKYLDKICTENDIHYCLCGGSLIGAVRHHGFIPWDDDIDVFMPRIDYEKLVSIVNHDTTTYKICFFDNTPEYGYSMPKMMDTRTTLIDYKQGNGKETISVFIDIFLLDGMSNNYIFSLIRFNFFRIFKRMVFLSKRSYIMESLVKTAIFTVPWLICRIIGTDNINKLFNNMCKKRNICDTKYIASCSGSYGNKEIYDRNLFSDFIRCKFEDSEFIIPSKYDLILKKVYGDYMHLPPEEKQISHHTSEEWWNE